MRLLSRLYLIRSIPALLVCLSSVAAVTAQNYKSDPVDEKLRARRQISINFVKSGSSAPDELADFQKFITGYYLPAMTKSDSASLGVIGKDRFDLFNQFVWRANPQTQAWLTKTIFDKMKGVASSAAYHPAVRYNAVLMIGLLDATYSTGTEAPKPLPEATDFLIKIIGAGLKNKAVPASLLVGSLVGLERHAQFNASLPQPTRDLLGKCFVAVMGKQQWEQEISTDVGGWMKCQAAAGLANLKTPGPNGAYLKAFLAILGDAPGTSTLKIDDRLVVAAKLANIPIKTGEIDAAATAKVLAQLAVDTAKAEEEIADKFLDLQIGGGGGMVAFNAAPPNPEDGFTMEEDRMVFERRRLVSRLDDLNKALGAVAAALPEKEKQAIGQIQAAIPPVLREAGKKDGLDQDLVNEVKRMAQQISTAAPEVGAVVPPPKKRARGGRMF